MDMDFKNNNLGYYFREKHSWKLYQGYTAFCCQ